MDLIDYANKIFGLKKARIIAIGYLWEIGMKIKNITKMTRLGQVEYGVQCLKKWTLYLKQRARRLLPPKIDVQVKKVNGHEETAFTVQYDLYAQTV